MVVVNTHLYGAHLASGGAVLPPARGGRLRRGPRGRGRDDRQPRGGGRPRPLPGAGHRRPAAAGRRRRRARSTPSTAVAEVGRPLQRVLRPLAGRRVSRPTWPMPAAPGGPPIPATDPLPVASRSGWSSVWRRRRRGPAGPRRRRPERGPRPRRGGGPGHRAGGPLGRPPATGRAGGRRRRVASGPVPAATGPCWPPGTWPPTWPACRRSPTTRWPGWRTAPAAPSLRVSPIDVGPAPGRAAVGRRSPACSPRPPCRSACPSGWAAGRGRTDELDVGSPFDYRGNALLYVAQSLPDRRRPESEPALHDELEALIRAAGGRTLALFTSWRAMHAAVDALRDRLPSRPGPVRPAQAGPGRGVPGRRVDLPVRHPRVLAGGGRPGPDPQPGHHRPDPVPPSRRPGARGPSGAGRAGGLRRGRPAPGRHPAGPGGRAPDPLGPGPRGGGGPRQPAGHRPLPGGAARPGAPDEADPGPPGGGGLPREIALGSRPARAAGGPSARG